MKPITRIIATSISTIALSTAFLILMLFTIGDLDCRFGGSGSFCAIRTHDKAGISIHMPLV